MGILIKACWSLGTPAEYITHEFVELGYAVTVFTRKLGDLKTRDVAKRVEVPRPLTSTRGLSNCISTSVQECHSALSFHLSSLSFQVPPPFFT